VEQATGENRIMISDGANGLTGTIRSAIPPHLFASRTRPNIIVMQLEIPLHTVIHVIDAASEAGIPVMLNPAPASESLPQRLYKNIEVLVVNESEAATLTGLDLSATTALERGVLPDKAVRATGWFARAGSRHVVVTLGDLGAVFRQHGEGEGIVKHIHAHKPEKVVDTTAAGDTFIGALAVSYVAQMRDNRSFSLETAVRQAIHAATWTVERRGTWEAMPIGMPDLCIQRM